MGLANMNDDLNENIIDSLNMLEILKDDLCDSAKIIGGLISTVDGEARGKLTAEAVAIYNLVNATAKALAVFNAHTRHFKREIITIQAAA